MIKPNHPGRRHRIAFLRDGDVDPSNARAGAASRRNAQIGTCLVLREYLYLANDISPRRRKGAEERFLPISWLLLGAHRGVPGFRPWPRAELRLEEPMRPDARGALPLRLKGRRADLMRAWRTVRVA